MQVLNTTSPLHPSGPTGAPKSTPSNTAPDSRARRPLCPTGVASTGSPPARWRSGTQDLQVAGRGQRRLIDVGDPPFDQREQDAAVQRGVEQRRVARLRAQLLDADRPLLLGIEEHAVGDLS